MDDIIFDLDNQTKNELNDIMDDIIVNQFKVTLVDLVEEAKRFKSQVRVVKDTSGVHYALSNYTVLFDFQEKIQQFLGNRPTQIIYVVDTKDEVFSYTIDAKDFGENFINSKGRVKGLPQDFRKNNQSLESKIQSLIGKGEQDHVLKAKNAFLGTRNRLNEFWSKTKSSQKQSGILLWKENKRWQKARIINMGDVREAYATALMIKHQDELDKLCEVETIGKNPYYSDELISNFFYNYISNVTNLAAIVEEDINQENLYQFSQDASGNTISYQYGVKSKRAQAPNLGLYVAFADLILENASEQQIREWIKSKKDNEAKRNLLFEDLSKEAQKVLQEQLNPIYKSLTKKINS